MTGPVIVDPAFYDAWLSPDTPQTELKAILAHDIDGELQFHRVGLEVNTARGGKEHPGLIEPVNPL